MKLKFKLASGQEKVLDLDERATVNDVLLSLGEEDFSFGHPPMSLIGIKGKLAMLGETTLRSGDVLWASKPSGDAKTDTGLEEKRLTSTGNLAKSVSDNSHKTSKLAKPEVIELYDDDDEDDDDEEIQVVSAPTSLSSSSSSKRPRLTQPASKPLFFQNPIDALGIPEGEEGCTATLSSLVLGENLKEAYVLNFSVDLENIVKRFFSQLRHVPVAFCVGESTSITPEEFDSCFPEVGSRLILAKCPPFGTHHSKMFVLFYGDRGVRIIIHTSNLETTNLFMHTEGSWYQDFPLKSRTQQTGAKASNSLQDFEPYLIRVLTASGIKEAAGMISKYDFSTAEVALVATVPRPTAYTTAFEISQNGLGRVQSLLDKERSRSPQWAERIRNWPVVLQGSSLGSQTSRVSATANWLIDELGRALGARKPTQVELVVVTKQEMTDSHYGIDGAQATFYKRENFQLPDVRRILRKWTPSNEDLPTRSLVLPHFKSYICYEPEKGREIAWAILGSHNCTKAAWGSWTSSTRDKLSCLSYELSIMFLPSIMKAAGDRRWSVVRNDWFNVPVRDTFVCDITKASPGEAVLPIPFRLPTTPYDFSRDEPFYHD